MSKFLCFLLAISFGHSALNATDSIPPIHIISYNIQLLPRWIAHLKHKPMQRVPFIAREMIRENPDIIVFQEAFSKPCNKKLIALLKPHFPYIAGPANEKRGFKLSSGVLILSKTPLEILETIQFDTCEKEDCMARKGAILVQTSIRNQSLQILGTHMEAGGTAELKTSQFTQIKHLVERHQKPGIAQFLCGDFNIRQTSDLYTKMLGDLAMYDSHPSGKLKYSADHALNDMNPIDPNERSLIDYIFLRNVSPTDWQVEREIMRYQAEWHKKRRDLSDHFAIKARIRFPSAP